MEGDKTLIKTLAAMTRKKDMQLVYQNASAAIVVSIGSILM